MTNQVAIVIGLFAGLIVGVTAAVTGSPGLTDFATGVQPIGRAFINLVRMVVIPLVVATIFTGVANLGSPKKLGRLGGISLGFFWVTTIIAIVMGMIIMRVAIGIFPVPVQTPPEGTGPQELPGAVEFLLGLIPANPFAAAADGALLPLMVFTVLFGAAVGTLREDHRAQLMSFAEAITAALIKLVHWVLWTAPIGVFALAAPVAAESGLNVLQSLLMFVVVVVMALVIFVVVVYLPLVALLGGVSPIRFSRASVGPWVIGMSTTSSAATLPAMLEAAMQRLGISRTVAGFVLALGAALNRSGSALFQGSAIIFLAALYGVPIPVAAIGAAVLATFLVSLTVTGVPSSSLVTLAPALETVGVPLSGIAILFGIDRIPDMVRTAVNVTGHMAAATVVERIEHTVHTPSQSGPDTRTSGTP
jgi:Na+/H+-dicarboxylate symporter